MKIESQESLRAKYNPEGSQLRLAQLRMLEMLKFVDSVCKKNNIPYWLDSGTLLGAIRHHAFIPWDDDIDIGMMRNDFSKFIRAVEKENNTQYILQTRKSDPGFYGDWPVLRDTKSEYILPNKSHNIKKYRGVQIDIFLFEKRTSRYLLGWSVFFWNQKFNQIEHGSLFWAKTIDVFCNQILYPFWRILGKIFFSDKIIRKSYGINSNIEITNEDLFPLKKELFEDCYFSIPNNYKKCLEQFFGNDYMEIPPEKKRVWHSINVKFYA